MRRDWKNPSKRICWIKPLIAILTLNTTFAHTVALFSRSSGKSGFIADLYEIPKKIHWGIRNLPKGAIRWGDGGLLHFLFNDNK